MHNKQQDYRHCHKKLARNHVSRDEGGFPIPEGLWENLNAARESAVSASV